MKLYLVLLLVGVAAAETLEDGYVNRERYYHETIGIKEAARIRAAEESSDFSGSRIVGDSNDVLGQFPHMGGLVITLNNMLTSVCGSSMISNTRAVTAAHCWWDGRNQANQFIVVYGSLTLFSGGTRVTTRTVRMHPQWSPLTITNDVAVIIHDHVGYTNFISAIPLASGSNLFVGVIAQAVGFGRQSDDSGIGTNQRLHYVNLEVISNTECSRSFGIISNSNICTSGVDGRSVCGGDSGGPLQYSGQLIGVVSFGSAAGCQRGHPQAFARVTTYNTWISANM